MQLGLPKYLLIFALFLSGCTGFAVDCPMKLSEPFCSWSKK